MRERTKITSTRRAGLEAGAPPYVVSHSGEKLCSEKKVYVAQSSSFSARCTDSGSSLNHLYNQRDQQRLLPTRRTTVKCLKVKLMHQLGVKQNLSRHLAKRLSFFPLCFIDPMMERQFFDINHSRYPMRMVLFGLGCLVVNTIIWAFVASHMTQSSTSAPLRGIYYMVLDHVQPGVFHAVQAFVCVCHVILSAAPWIPGLSIDLELSSFVILGISTGGILLFSLFGTSQIPIMASVTDHTFNGSSLLAVADFNTWTGCIADLASIGLTMAVDIVLPTRTKRSVWFHAFLITVSGSCRIYTATIMERTPYKTMASVILQIFVLLSLVTLAHCGRYVSELSERAAAYELIQSRDRLAQLDARVTTTHNKTSTAVEDLILTVKDCLRHISGAKLGNVEHAKKAEELLNGALRSLMRSENLYAIRFAPGVPDETDVARRYMTLFAGHSEEMNAQGNSLVSSACRGTSAGDREDPSTISSAFQSCAQLVLGTSSVSTHVSEVGSAEYTIKDYSLVDPFSIDLDAQCPVRDVGMAILGPYCSGTLNISTRVLESLLVQLNDLYQPNPYHNAYHAASVAQGTAVLGYTARILSAESILESLDHVTTFIAALAHDVGHPGRTNAFFVTTHDPLAIVYNDHSPLENFHSCLLFATLCLEETNIFLHISEERYKVCRKHIISLILATDMKQHFECISLFRIRRHSPDFNCMKNIDDAWQALHMILKSADLGHACAPWEQHNRWSASIVEEFYEQGDEEKLLGYPVSPLCDRTLHGECAASQNGFLEYVVLPLFQELAELDTVGMIWESCINQLHVNRLRWEGLAQNQFVLPLPEPQTKVKKEWSYTPIGSLLHTFQWLTATQESFQEKLPCDSNAESNYRGTLSSSQTPSGQEKSEDKLPRGDSVTLQSSGREEVGYYSESRPHGSMDVENATELYKDGFSNCDDADVSTTSPVIGSAHSHESPGIFFHTDLPSVEAGAHDLLLDTQHVVSVDETHNDTILPFEVHLQSSSEGLESS